MANVPRWVKLFGIVAVIVVVLLIVVFLGQGGHGPSRHSGGGVNGNAASAA